MSLRVAIVVILAALDGCSPRPDSPLAGNGASGSQDLNELPVAEVHAESEMEVHLAFRNSSTQPFSYMKGGWIDHPIALLEFFLLRDGKYVANKVQLEGPPFVPKNVRQINPGITMPLKVKLKSLYPRLKPGRYELRVEYNVTVESWFHQELGLTPLQIDKSLMYIQVK